MLKNNNASNKLFAFQKYAVCGVAALMLLGVTSRVVADPPVSLSPPVQSEAAPVTGDAVPDSTFQWTEVPQNQKVPLTRAVFDQNGYQLFDTAGETVLVPFTNNNLYVMKFAPSDDGTLYLINQGDTPVLYVPVGRVFGERDCCGRTVVSIPGHLPSGAAGLSGRCAKLECVCFVWLVAGPCGARRLLQRPQLCQRRRVSADGRPHL